MKSELLDILSQIYRINTGKFDYPVVKIVDPEFGKIKDTSLSEYSSLMWTQTKTLFNKSYLRITAILCYLQIGSLWLNMAMVLFFPKILQDSIMYANLHAESQQSTICEIENSFARSWNFTNDERSADHIECVEKMAFEAFGYPMITEISYTVGFFLVALLVNYFGMWTLSSEYARALNKNTVKLGDSGHFQLYTLILKRLG
jgi:hypothetical protein